MLPHRKSAKNQNDVDVAARHSPEEQAVSYKFSIEKNAVRAVPSDLQIQYILTAFIRNANAIGIGEVQKMTAALRTLRQVTASFLKIISRHYLNLMALEKFSLRTNFK